MNIEELDKLANNKCDIHLDCFILFHGSKSEDLKSIFENGLKKGAEWGEGQGIYTSPDREYAEQYGTIIEILDYPEIYEI